MEAEETLSSRVLAELRAVGGSQLVRELMAVFAERTPDRLRSAERSFAAGDLEGTAAALHSLRSAAGTIGAHGLVELAGRLERAARGLDDGDLASGLDEVQREAERVLGEARRLIDETSSQRSGSASTAAAGSAAVDKGMDRYGARNE